MKQGAAAALGICVPVTALAARRQSGGYFGVHPFIDGHPEAVFIMKTNVRKKMDSRAKKREGLRFGRSVFVHRDETGVPLNVTIPVKPNLKTPNNPAANSLEDNIGTVSDPWFMEGFYESIIELGVNGSQFHMRETNRIENLRHYPYPALAERQGADLRMDLGAPMKNLEPVRDYNWTEVRDGVVFERIPHLAPINATGTWMLNIAKLKAHYMGMTLCCKNLQGSTVANYQRFCHPFGLPDIFPDNQYGNAEERVKNLYARHLREGAIPRWDKPSDQFEGGGRYPGLDVKNILWGGGFTQETWTARTLDNISSTPCALHVVEGIYGRDGTSSERGPHPFEQDHKYGTVGFSSTGKSKDFMTNIVIFGKDPLLVDSVGFWLGGHEPGNFGFFHIAMERKMMKVVDPRKIPVYEWRDGEAILTPLEEFVRTPLLSFYLGKEGEPSYHLVDEPFDYDILGETPYPRPSQPMVTVLGGMLPDSLDGRLPIEYRLPSSGFVRLEIRNAAGKAVDVPVDGFRTAGVHLANWDTGKHPSGTYRYYLNVNGMKVFGDLRLARG